MNETNKTHWQNVLDTEFQTRKTRNTSYSLRAYARDLGLSQTLLLFLIKSKRRLTADKAFLIAKNLNLPAGEKLKFVESSLLH